MPSAILVTGGAGYIGSHTCKALRTAGFLPVVYDNLSHGHRWAVKWGPLIEADVGDRDALRDALRHHDIAAVMHFAGSINVGESMTAPGKYFANNFSNSIVLLDAMAEAGVANFVFSSTCAIYGSPQKLPIDEAHPQHPVSPYGESKLAVERALRWYETRGIRAAVLRYFNAAGADPQGEIGEDHDPETHLIPLAIAAAAGRRPHLEIYGSDYATADGTALRDYVHVSDLAQAHVLALNHLLAGKPGITLNLGTGHAYSVREVVTEVERVAGRKMPTLMRPRRAGDPPELVADSGRVTRELDWRPCYSELSTIVETAWQWHASRWGEDPAPAAPI